MTPTSAPINVYLCHLPPIGRAVRVRYRWRVIALLVVAAALGLDNFAASVGIGVSGVRRSVRVRVAVVFGLFETAMPIIGVLLGRGLASGLGGAARWTGGALLVAAGTYELISTLRERRAPAHRREQEHESELAGPAPCESAAPRPDAAPRGGVSREWKGWRLVLSGAGLSVDNLAVGFALGTTRVPFVIAAIVFGVVSVGMSLAGLELGTKIGAAVGERGELLAGLVLIAVGVVMATGRL
jgi:manganese efflux pump family protein